MLVNQSTLSIRKQGKLHSKPCCRKFIEERGLRYFSTPIERMWPLKGS